MKKEAVLLGVIVFLLSMQLCSALSIVPSMTTGKVTQRPVTVSLQILPSLPAVNIILPSNGTYLANISLSLDFLQTGVDNLSYNLDNGPNISITGRIRFNTSEGSHTLFLFASNVRGNSSAGVSFSVNLTKFFIIYENYKGANKGNSTQFYDFTYEQLQNISNMTLEDVRYGKIVWAVPINLTDSPSNTVDLDSDTNISFNHIYVDAGYLSNLNKDAIIYLYNLTLTNPVIMRNNVECSHSICSLISYSNGILIFNVTHFAQATFSAQETAPALISAPPKKGAPSVSVPSVPVTPAPPAAECIENWSCSQWSVCDSRGLQTRQCSDGNNCGTNKTIPLTRKVCYLPEMPKAIAYLLIVVFVILIIVVVSAVYSILAAARKRRWVQKFYSIMRMAHSYLDEGEVKHAFEQYARLRQHLGEGSSKISKEDFKKFHSKGIELYRELASR